ncbi:SMI1/KNR4 family protein [Longispora albida]|uniref:SMI1/KNR4 family protein n=1 Tax=Longispora albida TaxID=203523 RepID=UPI00037F8471|nr:SMI1/KNR4 family protein [Longispora albida]
MESLSSDASFGEPATEAELAAIADRLGQQVPEELSALLGEVGTVQDAYGTDIVWPADRIAEENSEFRSDVSYGELYMPFDSLMFFGEAGDGSRFAYVRQPVRPDVFVWDHETDGRWWIASGMRDFLSRYFAAEAPDWYQR